MSADLCGAQSAAHHLLSRKLCGIKRDAGAPGLESGLVRLDIPEDYIISF